MAKSVIVAAFLRGRVGKEEELVGRLQALVLASRSDAGVITYDLHHSCASPKFHLHSKLFTASAFFLISKGVPRQNVVRAKTDRFPVAYS